MPEANSTSIIPIDDLFTKYAEWKNGHSKSLAIVRSTSSLTSTIASGLLILTIFRSPKRLSTAYHRLLLGMSISDILFSLSQSSFNSSSPSDVSYIAWNARGNQATCTAQGLITAVGWAATLCYICSLNFYYLALVKHDKTETYIRTKIEPFLHGIPILVTSIYSIIFLVNRNFNGSYAGVCHLSPIYNPPHCTGYDEGEVREGFEIPCGRGRNGNLYLGSVLLGFSAPPIIICVSLAMIYKSVAKQEKRIARYGVGSLNPSAQQTSGDDGGERANECNNDLSRSVGSLVSSMSSRFGRRESSNPLAVYGDKSNSRAVMHKALAYSISYFLTWGWSITSFIMVLAGAEIPVAFLYMWYFMTPLQGLFNFLVYLHPKVMKAKRSPGQNLSWCQALGTAFWSGINGPTKKTNAPPVHDTGGRDKKKNPPAAASDNKGNNVATDGATSLQTRYNSKFTDIEEEKTEIRAPQDGDDWDDSNVLESNQT